MNAPKRDDAPPGWFEMTWQPAPLRRRRTLRLDDGVVSLRTASGRVLWRMALGELRMLGYGSVRVRDRLMLHLDLWDDAGRRRLSVNASPAAGARLAGFLRLLQVLLAEIAAQQPQIPVRTGLVGGERVAMFATGLLILAIGGGLGVLSLTSGQEAMVVAAGTLAAGGLALGAVPIMRPNLPWRPPLSLPLASFLAQHPELAPAAAEGG